jgi:hypothetical protein
MISNFFGDYSAEVHRTWFTLTMNYRISPLKITISASPSGVIMTSLLHP